MDRAYWEEGAVRVENNDVRWKKYHSKPSIKWESRPLIEASCASAQIYAI